MASEQSFVTIKEQETSEMSKVCHTINALNLASAKTWTFSQSYETQSKILKTSWRYEMTFNYLPESKNVSCSFILIRNDSECQPVNAIFRVSFSHEKHRFPLYTETFKEDNMLPGVKLQGYIAEIIPYPRLKFRLEQVMIIDIFIIVSHPKNNIEDLTSSCQDMNVEASTSSCQDMNVGASTSSCEDMNVGASTSSCQGINVGSSRSNHPDMNAGASTSNHPDMNVGASTSYSGIYTKALFSKL